MAGERENLEEPLEKEGSLVGECDGKGLLGSDLHIDGVFTGGNDADKVNDDVGFDGSKEDVKDVCPIGGGASGDRLEGSENLGSLESKSENERAELYGNDATMKTLDEQKNIDHSKVNKILEKEGVSDVVQVESDVWQSIEGQAKAGFSEQVGSHGEQDIEDEEFDDAEQRKTTDEKIVKRRSVKSSGKFFQATYELRTEKEGEFSVYDIVWGKVKSHPWWPGQIFDPSDASVQAKKYSRKDRYLVAYFGDKTFAWNEASQLKPFRTHFPYIIKQSSSEVFQNAVDCALDEVTRRVEFGLACSCIPKHIYDKIKLQIVENAGIQQELNLVNRVDESLSTNSFSPVKLLEYLKALSEFPTGSFGRLELLIAKAQLLAFYRLKGYSSLPELQYGGGLDNDVDASIDDTDKHLNVVNKHATHVSKRDGETGTGNLKTAKRSGHKRKHNLKDSLYPEKKQRSLPELSGTPDPKNGDYQSDEATDNPITPASTKKRTIDHCAAVSGMKYGRKTIAVAKVSSTTKQPFKIGECIRRVASQLTKPPSMLKCSGDGYQLEDGSPDGFSGNGSDVLSPHLEETQKSSLIAPSEYSSLDDLLSLLKLVAQEPLVDYGFLNVIVSFFSDFRNSIVVANDSGKEISPTKKVSAKTKKRPAAGSPKTFEFDDLGGMCLADMVIQRGSVEQQSKKSSRKDSEHTPAEAEKPVQVAPTLRIYSRKRRSDKNHAELPEKPSSCTDEKSTAEIVLNFAELDSVPSEITLNKIFRRFGPLNESETEVDRGSSRARVVFKRCADAEVAFSSAKKFNIFGSILVNYKLNYTPSTFFKASPPATTQD
ncbi:hypothetical protein RJT34_23574 [Clitoria ternatea]|uniref:PWWP domain-containing protein n=1 Tax=Clitoria ternatea TaxID=43366 RepID=A0AAN9IHB3_CLITE